MLVIRQSGAWSCVQRRTWPGPNSTPCLLPNGLSLTSCPCPLLHKSPQQAPLNSGPDIGWPSLHLEDRWTFENSPGVLYVTCSDPGCPQLSGPYTDRLELAADQGVPPLPSLCPPCPLSRKCFKDQSNFFRKTCPFPEPSTLPVARCYLPTSLLPYTINCCGQPRV